MKKALISPNEIVKDFNNTPIGVRVCEVSNSSFEVAEPMYWLDCNDNVVADSYYLNSETNKITQKQPFKSWVWNESTESWEAPVPYPTDGKRYAWDELTLSWIELPN